METTNLDGELTRDDNQARETAHASRSSPSTPYTPPTYTYVPDSVEYHPKPSTGRPGKPFDHTPLSN